MTNYNDAVDPDKDNPTVSFSYEKPEPTPSHVGVPVPPSAPYNPAYQAPQAPYAVAPITNQSATMSLVFSLLGFLIGPLSIVGVIFGHKALKEIKVRQENGRGMAIAGLIIGYALIACFILLVIFWIFLFIVAGISASSNSY